MDTSARNACGCSLLWIGHGFAPFIVQLVGEYVIEIVQAVAEAIAEANVMQFSDFVRENPKFMATTRRQATSYWNCYYRSRFPTLQTYPGISALDAIDQMARSV